MLPTEKLMKCHCYHMHSKLRCVGILDGRFHTIQERESSRSIYQKELHIRNQHGRLSPSPFKSLDHISGHNQNEIFQKLMEEQRDRTAKKTFFVMDSNHYCFIQVLSHSAIREVIALFSVFNIAFNFG